MDNYKASELLLAALSAVREELGTLHWNKYQEDTDPFGNTGENYKNDVFEVESYSWTAPEPYNFKWRDFEVSWYKYLGTDTTCNREITPDEIEIMLEECLESVRKDLC